MKDAIKRHSKMVSDELRTKPLIASIRRAVKKGDVVVDIGTGTGILAIEALKCGASKAYAIDTDRDALDVCARIAHREKVENRLIIIEGFSFDVEIEGRADIIICEAVGSYGFDENILYTLWDAKKRFLKKGGLIIPESIELWGVMISKNPKTDPVTGIGYIDKGAIISETLEMVDVGTYSYKKDSFKFIGKFAVKRDGYVTGIALWPKVKWLGKYGTDASPFMKKTHWKQGILPLKPIKVGRGQILKIYLEILPDPADPFGSTEILWKLIKAHLPITHSLWR